MMTYSRSKPNYLNQSLELLHYQNVYCIFLTILRTNDAPITSLMEWKRNTLRDRIDNQTVEASNDTKPLFDIHIVNVSFMLRIWMYET